MKTSITSRQYSWHTNHSHSNCITNGAFLALSESQVHWFTIWTLPAEEPWIISITLYVTTLLFKWYPLLRLTYHLCIYITELNVARLSLLPLLPWEHCSSGWSNLKRQPGRVPSRVQSWNGVGIMAVTSSPSLTSAYTSGYKQGKNWCCKYSMKGWYICHIYLYIDIVPSTVWPNDVFIVMVVDT